MVCCMFLFEVTENDVFAQLYTDEKKKAKKKFNFFFKNNILCNRFIEIVPKLCMVGS